MDRVKEYRLRAQECRHCASEAASPQIRAHYLSMAETWEILANQREAFLAGAAEIASVTKDQGSDEDAT